MRSTRLMLALLPMAGLSLTACTTGTTASPTTPTTVSSTPPPTTTTTQPACQPRHLKAEPAVATTTATSVIVQSAVKNTGTTTCVIQGYPQVAITGLPPATGNWPHEQLTVTKIGPSYPVTLVPGDGAALLLTFKRCEAGQPPAEQGPVLLVGVPDGGIQMTMQDNSDFVGCGDVVEAAAFAQHLP
ncbi:DUF4232 domain-containing protein [Lentzea sp. NPDC004789]